MKCAFSWILKFSTRVISCVYNMHTICKTYFNPTEKHRLFIDFSSIHLYMSSKKTKYLNWEDLFYWLKQTFFVFIILFLLTCKPMMQIWWIIISELVTQVKWHNLWSILKFCWCNIYGKYFLRIFVCSAFFIQPIWGLMKKFYGRLLDVNWSFWQTNHSFYSRHNQSQSQNKNPLCIEFKIVA